MKEFEARYAEIFGKRWPSLREALLEPSRHVARVNPYADRAEVEDQIGEDASILADLPGCYVVDEGEGEFAPPQADPAGLLPYYLMDAASVAAARALEVRPGQRVLDMCAAPGGKTLILAEALGDTGRLIANERSLTRRKRLERVIEEYLPASVRAQIKVTGHDATKWGLHEKDVYDRILLDAPCSSERHVLHDPTELAKWSWARTKRLAVQQHAMLASAVDAARSGGRIVYSTCALSPLENDGVISRLMKKRGDRVRIIRPETPGTALAERTEHGFQILPDRSGGWGPIYFAVIEKL